MRILLLSLLLITCRASTDQVSRPGYIIDRDDIVRLDRVNFEETSIDPFILQNAIKSSVLIVTGVNQNSLRFCSGSMIAGENARSLPRIITNQHCFAKKNEKNVTFDDVIDNACTETKVFFDFSVKTKPLSRKCLKDSLKTSFIADLAIFTLDAELPDEYAPFSIWNGQVPTGRRAFIVHHPCIEVDGKCCFEADANCPQHVLEELEQNEMHNLQEYGLKFPKKAITTEDCHVIGKFSKELWKKKPTLALGLRHRCDLVNGSSGSGLIDAETGKLLGVNWGGVTINTTSKHNIASSSVYMQEFITTGNVFLPETATGIDKILTSCGAVGTHASTFLLLLPLLSPIFLLTRRKL